MAGLSALSAVNASTPAANVKQAFQEAVGGTFYSQLMQAMRKTVGEPAYFHGGEGEKMFQAQLDQVIAEQMSQQHGAELVETLFERFEAGRKAAGPENSLLSAQAADSSQLIELVRQASSVSEEHQKESATPAIGRLVRK